MKPILFNTDMVRAILDGHKTVTRRVVKEKGWKITGRPKWSDEPTWQKDGFFFNVSSDGKKETARTATTHLLRPPYIVGDILWVRETWAKDADGEYVYRTDYGTTEDDSFPPSMFKWRPSIHMPREAARIFLRVTDLRAERLQEITEDGAKAEGAVKSYPYTDPGTGETAFMLDEKGTFRCVFPKIWDSTIKPADRPAYGWEANPWVWAIKFERISKEEASK